jgi:hypothetical protein
MSTEKISTLTETEQAQAIFAMESAIRKSERALASMGDAPASAGLKKRLMAFQIGLAALRYAWFNEPFIYLGVEVTDARDVLAHVLSQLPSYYEKMKPGSPQRTTISRRMKAIELAIKLLDVAATKE